MKDVMQVLADKIVELRKVRREVAGLKIALPLLAEQPDLEAFREACAKSELPKTGENVG